MSPSWLRDNSNNSGYVCHRSQLSSMPCRNHASSPPVALAGTSGLWCHVRGCLHLIMPCPCQGPAGRPRVLRATADQSSDYTMHCAALRTAHVVPCFHHWVRHACMWVCPAHWWHACIHLWAPPVRTTPGVACTGTPGMLQTCMHNVAQHQRLHIYGQSLPECIRAACADYGW